MSAAWERVVHQVADEFGARVERGGKHFKIYLPNGALCAQSVSPKRENPDAFRAQMRRLSKQPTRSTRSKQPTRSTR